MDLTLKENKLYQTKNQKKEIESIHLLSLICDSSKNKELVLLRKYPEKRRMIFFQNMLKGAVITGNNEEKKDIDTLYTFNHTPYPYLQQIELNKSSKYRYYRLTTHNKQPVNIAHMEFLGPYSANHNCTFPTNLPIFPDTQKENNYSVSLYRVNGTPLRTGSNPEVAFDGNFETFVGSSTIAVDFNTPVEITHIRLIPRNANNMIVIGDSYELLYYDHEWKSQGTIYAETNYLEFKDVPDATLFWLRNLSGGKEELPFFYINGKQFFLHTDTLKNLQK